jgi:hypothetical protein
MSFPPLFLAFRVVSLPNVNISDFMVHIKIRNYKSKERHGLAVVWSCDRLTGLTLSGMLKEDATHFLG